jgi:hypothetical protein
LVEGRGEEEGDIGERGIGECVDLGFEDGAGAGRLRGRGNGDEGYARFDAVGLKVNVCKTIHGSIERCLLSFYGDMLITFDEPDENRWQFRVDDR